MAGLLLALLTTMAVASVPTGAAGAAGAADAEDEATGAPGALRVVASDMSAWPDVAVTVAGPPAGPDGAEVEAYTVDAGGTAVPAAVERTGATRVVLLLDTSGAAAGTAIRELRAAAVEFLLSAGAEVGTAVVAAGPTPQVLSPMSAGVTSVVAALDGLAAPGPPGLADDLAAAVGLLGAEDGSPSAVVVLSPRAGPDVERELAPLAAGVDRPGLEVWVVHPEAGEADATGPLHVVDAAPLGLAATTAGVARDLDGLYVVRFRAEEGRDPVDLRLVEGGRTYRATLPAPPGRGATGSVLAVAGRVPADGVRPRGLVAGLVGAAAVAVAGWGLRRQRASAVAGSVPAMFATTPAPTLAVPWPAPPARPPPPAAADGPRPPPADAAGRPRPAPADEAPPGYAVRRSPWVAPAFVAVLVVTAVAVAAALDTAVARYAELVAELAGGPAGTSGGGEPTASFRPVLAVFFVLLGLFGAGPPGRRLTVAATTSSLYLAVVLVCDVVMASAPAVLPPPLSAGGGVVSGLAGIGVLVAAVVLHHEMPAAVDVERQVPPDLARLGTLVPAVALALTAAVAWSALLPGTDTGTGAGVLDGAGPALVVFLLALWASLAAVAAYRHRRRPPTRSDVSVAFLVPTHDDAAHVGRCIRAIDAAATRHPARCHLYVVDQSSTDGTAPAARDAIGRCIGLTGEVVESRRPGRGHALNVGLAAIREDVVVTVDPAVAVEPRLLRPLLSWFADRRVGAVVGLLLPGPSPLRRLPSARAVEVLYGVAFLRAAHTGAGAVVVAPGLVSSYRTRVLRALGGFGQGFDGVDADATVRTGRAGYRIVTDPSVRARVELPPSLGELRAERRRWAREQLHVAARNVPAVRRGQGARGLVSLPLSFANAARRALTVPVLLAAGVVEVVEPGVLGLAPLWAAAAGLLAVQLLVAAVVLVATGEARLVRDLPAYLALRVVRAYAAFEAVLTLRLRPRRPRSPA